MHIAKMGVVGAGTMGAGIAALAASAGVSVVLLDVPGTDERNGPAKRGLGRALKARPAAFMDPERARLVTLGNTEDDLEALSECDWVIEAIVEKPEAKRDLYRRLEPLLKKTAVVSSNTSGIPMKILLEGRTDAFKKRFLGAHFFNPPRYLHLLELIPTPDTEEGVLKGIRRFGERVLGKGTVIAKDSPGFIANRLGVYGMVQALRLMEEHGLGIDAVDALTGPLLGRPKSATFRTADLTGLDVLTTVAAELGSATGEDFGLPDWVQTLVRSGALGEKTGAGFYKKEGKAILTLEYQTGEYRPQEKLKLPELKALRDRPLRERLEGALELSAPYGVFVRELLAHTFHYALSHAADIAYELPAIDEALEWGFGWEEGPLKAMDRLGPGRVRELFQEAGLGVPELLGHAHRGFYDRGWALTTSGQYAPRLERPGRIGVGLLRQGGKMLRGNDEASLLDLGDGVALLEFHSRMNTIGEGTLRLLREALDYLERENCAGLVIGNDDSRAFSAGANLQQAMMSAQAGGWQALEGAVAAFQDASLSLRRAPFPVVAAPHGLTLGGGAEFALHADRVQTPAELYMGLVEAGVGLIPAGGGTKELLFRFTRDLEPYAAGNDGADPFEAVKRAFQLIAAAKTSTSALEARKMGFLRHGDAFSMNRDFLIADAKGQVLALAPGYRAPLPTTITALGSQALGNLRYAVWQFQEAGQISEHDATIGLELAYVLAGGEGAPHEVSEQDILGLEREAFLKLLGMEKTQARIFHMLQTGKPLRN